MKHGGYLYCWQCVENENQVFFFASNLLCISQQLEIVLNIRITQRKLATVSARLSACKQSIGMVGNLIVHHNNSVISRCGGRLTQHHRIGGMNEQEYPRDCRAL